MKPSLKQIAAISLFFVVFSSAPGGRIQAADTPLFTPIPPSWIPITERDDPCRSSIPLAPDVRSMMQYVTLNGDRVAALRTTQTFFLSLFDDRNVTAVLREIAPRPSGESGYLWNGTLADVPESSVILVVGEGQLYGRIGLPGRYITLHQIEGEVYAIEQHELDADPVTLVAVEPALSNAAPLSLPNEVQPLEDDSQISVMVVYTPAAKSILERVVGSVSLAVDGAIAYTNAIFVNSGISTRLNLVHVEPVFYLEQPNEAVSADLQNLMGKSDGYMDEVHPLRDLYAADLVAMISGVWFASYAGIAPTPSPLDEAKGFSITEACNIQDTTFTEQIGLNLGSARDIAHANSSDEHPVLNYGYGYQAPDASFVTVMARRTGGVCPPIVTANVCSKIERFSSPGQTYNGQPTGTALADNVRSINELAMTVANYRTANPDTTTQIVINGGFEIDADADQTPDFWKTGSTGKSKTDCIDAGHNSLCALKLSGAGSRATQVLDSEMITSNTPILVAVWVRTKKLITDADVRLILHQVDDSKSVIKVMIPPGKLKDFQLLSANGMADQPVSKTKLVARLNASETGKLWLDDVSVTVYNSARTE
jgi:hypothetical protein